MFWILFYPLVFISDEILSSNTCVADLPNIGAKFDWGTNTETPFFYQRLFYKSSSKLLALLFNALFFFLSASLYFIESF